jgi:competence protein ComEA
MKESDDGGIRERLADHGLSSAQVFAWAAVAVVILLVGGNYLRSHMDGDGGAGITTDKIGLESGDAGAPGPGGTTGAAEVTGDESGTEPLIVHVAGSVVAPGVYELMAGDRAADAIGKAGGVLPEADLDRVNLAALLSDGQQLFVPAKGEAAPTPAGGAAAVSGQGGGGATSGLPVNLNTANAAELEQLDGVGEKTAQKIIAYREETGGFTSIEQLMEVPGIGPAKFDAIRENVKV